MDVHLFKFSNEAYSDLVKFRKIAKVMKLKSNHSNIESYNRMKIVFQSEEILDHQLDSNHCIYVASSDEDDNKYYSDHYCSLNDDIGPNTTQLKVSSEHDLVYAIKENLEVQLHLDCVVLQNLNKLSATRLVNLFKLLKEDLNGDHLKNVGLSLQNTQLVNEIVIEHFIKHLLLSKLCEEYTDDLQSLFEQYFSKHNMLMEVELSKIIFEHEDYTIILLYIAKLSLKSKSNIFGCEKLEERHIEILNSLLNSQLDYDLLNKLIELMTKQANDFSADKNFGKLIISVIKYLGKNMPLLQQPLKHIIGVHKSVWKAKIQKEFSACLDENLYSQSLTGT